MLSLRGVTRRFGRRTAVEDLSFDIDGFGVVGLLGPNGAGKTTTMRLIAGALMPSAGAIEVAGHCMRTRSLGARRQIGYLPENPPVYPEMPVLAYLEFAGRLRGLRGPELRRNALAAAGQCALDDRLDVEIGKLSRGQRQRVGIAQAIVHGPALLILDEPTNGLDPVQLAEAHRLIARLGENRLILLSTHNLTEVASLCRTSLFLRGGRLVAEQAVGTGLAAPVRLLLKDPHPQMTARLAALPGVRAVRTDGAAFVVEPEPGAEPNRAIVALVHEAGWTLLGFTAQAPGLEALFDRYSQ